MMLKLEHLISQYAFAEILQARAYENTGDSEVNSMESLPSSYSQVVTSCVPCGMRYIILYELF